MQEKTHWSELYDDGADYRTLTSHELTTILGYLPESDSVRDVLDIGCGTGRLARDLSKTKPFICVDFDHTVEQLKSNFNAVSAHSLGDIEYFMLIINPR